MPDRYSFDSGRITNPTTAISMQSRQDTGKLSATLAKQAQAAAAAKAKQAQAMAAAKANLTRGLLEQAKVQAAGLGAIPAGVPRFGPNWGIDDPVASVLAAAPGTGMVQTQPMAYAEEQPSSIPPSIAVQQQPQQQRARVAGAGAPGIISAPTATRAGVFEQGALSRNPGLFSLIGPVDKIDRQEKTYGRVGSVAGGLLGGLVGGPIGGLLGAFAGKTMGKSVGANGGFGKGSTGSGGKGSSSGKGAESSGRSNGAGSRAGERSGWAGR